MGNKLNAIRYYGGKSVLCDIISEQMEYRNSKVYIEMFGGGANILLNKPKHAFEIYNEIDTGIYTLFKVLSSRDSGWELYYHLRGTGYSRDVFERNLSIREKYLVSGFELVGNEQYRYARRIEDKYGYDLIRDYRKSGGIDKTIVKKIRDFKLLNREELEEAIWLNKKNSEYMDSISEDAGDVLHRTSGILEDLKKIYNNIYKKEIKKINNITDMSPLRKCIVCKEILESIRNLDIGSEAIKANIYATLYLIEGIYDQLYSFNMDKKPCTWEEELELAAATFIVFNMSRDGRGKTFSNISNGEDLFFRKTQNLLDVIERMNGVTVTDYDCFTALEDIRKTFGLGMYDDDEIFIYFDPPYLQEAGSIITGKHNPGMVYDYGFRYDDHKKLLGMVQKLPFKIAVSNYRDKTGIYDSYLNKDNGWHSIEIETKTTVGNSKDRDRTEVLWMNYNI